MIRFCPRLSQLNEVNFILLGVSWRSRCFICFALPAMVLLMKKIEVVELSLSIVALILQLALV